MTTQIKAIRSGQDLAYELRIAASRATVWTFWTEPDRLVRWMGDVASIEPRPGGRFRLEYKTGDVAAGEYVEVDEPRRLVFTWGWEEAGAAVPSGASTVEVDLEPLEGGAATRLRLRHVGLPADSRVTHDEGWMYFLARLGEAAGRG
jgi:uncharacterized protein YndB with AHSA1/START domain